MLTQREWEKLNKVVDSIYSINNITLMRREFLEGLSQLISFAFSDFELGHGKEQTAPRLLDAVVVSDYPKEFEEEFIGLYESKYWEMDYVKWVFSSPSSLVYRESDLISEQARKNSKFYIEYLYPSGLVNVSGISIISKGNFIGSVTLYKKEMDGDFSKKDIYILEQLLPHLQNKLESQSENIHNNLKKASYILSNRYCLTPREIEIIGYIYKGDSNNQICESLNIAQTTVKKHISNIFDKLNVNSRTLLIHFLVENGLV